MSFEEFVGYLHRNNSLTKDDIASLATQFQQLNPRIDDITTHELIVKGTEYRTRVNSESIAYATGSSKKSETRSRVSKAGTSGTLMRRKIPRPVYFYPLVHTNSGTYTFPKVAYQKYAGGLQTDGTFYQTVATDARLNQTAKISIAGFLYLPTISSTGIVVVKDNQYELSVKSGNKLSWRTYSSGAWRTAIEYTFTINTWFNFLVTYDSTVGHKIIINGALSTSDSLTGALGTSSNNLGIFGSATGTNKMITGCVISHLHMNKNALDTTWATNFGNGITDTVGSNIEITTIPFVQDVDPRPDATCGMCMCSP